MVVVLPTGEGKSLLFLLLSLLPGSSVTVVVLPLAALQQDLVRRCSECRISFMDERRLGLGPPFPRPRLPSSSSVLSTPAIGRSGRCWFSWSNKDA